MTAVALYARISRDPAGRLEGVDRQERWGRDYAARVWPDLPVAAYADNNLSGDPAIPRPGLEALRAAVRSGAVAAVWAVEQSRLTRDEVQWFEIAAELLDAGVDVLHTDRDGIVRLDEIGGIRAVLNAAERRKLRQRVNATLDDLAAQGRPGGGHHVAYRHTTDADGRAALEVIPEVAEAVRWAADHVLAGWSLTAVAAELEARGIPTAHGGRWKHGNVKGMLTSPIVAGLRVHRGEVLRPGTWPAVLDEVRWRQLGAILGRPRRDAARSYALSGIARCGLCEGGLTGRRQHRRGQAVPYYYCAPTVGGCSRLAIIAAPLEEHVRDRLLEELDRRAAFGAALAEDAAAEQRAELTGRLADIDDRHVELARRWAAGDLPAAAWDAARTDLDADRSRLARELAEVPPPTGRIDAVELREAWGLMTVDERRHVLRRYIDRIDIAPAVPGRRFDNGRAIIVWREV